MGAVLASGLRTHIRYYRAGLTYKMIKHAKERNRKLGFVPSILHVAVVELEDLWTQYWHRGYEPRYDIIVPD